MRILFVSSGNAKNGISPIVLNQGQSLINNEFSIDFFTIKGRGLISYLKHIFILRAFLKKNNYHIIHAHYGLCGIISLLAKRKEKIVVSFMGDDLLGTNKFDGHISLVSKILASINIYLAFFFYDHSIVKSNEMFRYFNGRSNISLIPNGVDLKKFRQIERCEALKQTLFANDKKHVIFVSDPNRIEKNYILAKKAIDSLQNNPVVFHVLNGIPNELLIYYYNSADLLLMTSLHEGSPNVIKEAMACNCPIVSTEVGDITWLFGNIDGYFVTTYKIDDVSAKINNALEFNIKQGRTKGSNRILELDLNIENVAIKMHELYKNILKFEN